MSFEATIAFVKIKLYGSPQSLDGGSITYYLDAKRLAEQERQRAEQAEKLAEQERQRAEQERQRAERAEQLLEQLKNNKS